MRLVAWGNAMHSDCTGTIVSVQEHERGIAYNDKNLAINWQLPLQKLKLSEKDKNYPLLSETFDLFE